MYHPDIFYLWKVTHAIIDLLQKFNTIIIIIILKIIIAYKFNPYLNKKTRN